MLPLPLMLKLNPKWLMSVQPKPLLAAAGTSGRGASAHVPAPTGAAEGTSGVGASSDGGASADVAEDTSGDGSGHGSAGTSSDGASHLHTVPCQLAMIMMQMLRKPRILPTVRCTAL